ncbi:MAG: hypothetical protein ACYCOO_01965 [Chitinophagaceae bacterium]
MPNHELPQEHWLQKLKNKYRLVVLNEDTFEEVTSFKLSRMSVYITLSTFFVLMVTFSVALVVFTPLKYYIPGFGNMKQRQEFIQLNMKVDSLENVEVAKDKYLQNIQSVLSGHFNPSRLDTTRLNIPTVLNSTN